MVDVDSGEHVGVAPSVPLVQFTPHGEQEFVQSVRRHRGQLVQATYVALLDGAVPLDVVARYRAPSPPHDFVASVLRDALLSLFVFVPTCSNICVLRSVRRRQVRYFVSYLGTCMAALRVCEASGDALGERAAMGAVVPACDGNRTADVACTASDAVQPAGESAGDCCLDAAVDERAAMGYVVPACVGNVPDGTACAAPGAAPPIADVDAANSAAMCGVAPSNCDAVFTVHSGSPLPGAVLSCGSAAADVVPPFVGASAGESASADCGAAGLSCIATSLGGYCAATDVALLPGHAVAGLMPADSATHGFMDTAGDAAVGGVHTGGAADMDLLPLPRSDDHAASPGSAAMLPVAPSQWKAVVGRFRRLVSCLHPTLANKITQMVYDAAVDGVTTEEALALVVQHSGPDEIVVCCADCIDVLRVHAFELLSATQPARGRGMGTEGGAEGALTSTDSKWLQEYLRDLTLLRGLVRDIAAAPPSLGNHMMATLICLAWDAPDNQLQNALYSVEQDMLFYVRREEREAMGLSGSTGDPAPSGRGTPDEELLANSLSASVGQGSAGVEQPSAAEQGRSRTQTPCEVQPILESPLTSSIPSPPENDMLEQRAAELMAAVNEQRQADDELMDGSRGAPSAKPKPVSLVSAQKRKMWQRVLLLRCFASLRTNVRCTGLVYELPCNAAIARSIYNVEKTAETRLWTGAYVHVEAGDCLDFLNMAVGPLLRRVSAVLAICRGYGEAWAAFGRRWCPALPSTATEEDAIAFAYNLHKRVRATNGELLYPSLDKFKEFSEEVGVVVWQLEALPFNPFPARKQYQVIDAVQLHGLQSVPIQNNVHEARVGYCCGTKYVGGTRPTNVPRDGTDWSLPTSNVRPLSTASAQPEEERVTSMASLLSSLKEEDVQYVQVDKRLKKIFSGRVASVLELVPWAHAELNALRRCLTKAVPLLHALVSTGFCLNAARLHEDSTREVEARHSGYGVMEQQDLRVYIGFEAWLVEDESQHASRARKHVESGMRTVVDRLGAEKRRAWDAFDVSTLGQWRLLLEPERAVLLIEQWLSSEGNKPMRRALGMMPSVFNAWAVDGPLLGEGGFGQVWPVRCATDGARRDNPALSTVCKVQHIDKWGFGGFKMESFILHKLRNDPELPPNLLWGICGGSPAGSDVGYLLTPRLGPSLADVLKEYGVLSMGDALLATADLAVALRHLQAHGVVHFDVKPQNAMFSMLPPFTAETVLVLADYGIAEFTNPGECIHANGGTWGYMSPEAEGVFGRGRICDQRADVWSFASTLHTIWYGRPMFLHGDVLLRAKKRSDGKSPEAHMAQQGSNVRAMVKAGVEFHWEAPELPVGATEVPSEIVECIRACAVPWWARPYIDQIFILPFGTVGAQNAPSAPAGDLNLIGDLMEHGARWPWESVYASRVQRRHRVRQLFPRFLRNSYNQNGWLSHVGGTTIPPGGEPPAVPAAWCLPFVEARYLVLDWLGRFERTPSQGVPQVRKVDSNARLPDITAAPLQEVELWRTRRRDSSRHAPRGGEPGICLVDDVFEAGGELDMLSELRAVVEQIRAAERGEGEYPTSDRCHYVYNSALVRCPLGFNVHAQGTVDCVDCFCGVGGSSRGSSSSFDSVIGIEKMSRRLQIWSAAMEDTPCIARGIPFEISKASPLPWPRAINAWSLDDADGYMPWVMTGSPPCSPYARQGKRRGAADARDCIPGFIAAIRHSRPSVVLMEEVENLANFADVVEHLVSSLRDMRYCVCMHICNAAHYGTPQHRRRLMLVASLFGPVDAPGWTVTELVTVGDAFKALNSFEVDRHPDLNLTEQQLQVIRRYEELSGVHRSRDTVAGEPSRCVTATNTACISGGALRLLLEDGETRRALTPVEVGVLQGFAPEVTERMLRVSSPKVLMRAMGDAIPTQLSAAWARQIRAHVDEVRDLVRALSISRCRLAVMQRTGLRGSAAGALIGLMGAFDPMSVFAPTSICRIVRRPVIELTVLRTDNLSVGMDWSGTPTRCFCTVLLQAPSECAGATVQIGSRARTGDVEYPWCQGIPNAEQPNAEFQFDSIGGPCVVTLDECAQVELSGYVAAASELRESLASGNHIGAIAAVLVSDGLRGQHLVEQVETRCMAADNVLRSLGCLAESQDPRLGNVAAAMRESRLSLRSDPAGDIVRATENSVKSQGSDEDVRRSMRLQAEETAQSEMHGASFESLGMHMKRHKGEREMASELAAAVQRSLQDADGTARMSANGPLIPAPTPASANSNRSRRRLERRAVAAFAASSVPPAVRVVHASKVAFCRAKEGVLAPNGTRDYDMLTHERMNGGSDMVGGKAEDGESPAAALVRELFEEWRRRSVPAEWLTRLYAALVAHPEGLQQARCVRKQGAEEHIIHVWAVDVSDLPAAPIPQPSKRALKREIVAGSIAWTRLSAFVAQHMGGPVEPYAAAVSRAVVDVAPLATVDRAMFRRWQRPYQSQVTFVEYAPDPSRVTWAPAGTDAHLLMAVTLPPSWDITTIEKCYSFFSRPIWKPCFQQTLREYTEGLGETLYCPDRGCPSGRRVYFSGQPSISYVGAVPWRGAPLAPSAAEFERPSDAVVSGGSTYIVALKMCAANLPPAPFVDPTIASKRVAATRTAARRQREVHVRLEAERALLKRRCASIAASISGVAHEAYAFDGRHEAAATFVQHAMRRSWLRRGGFLCRQRARRRGSSTEGDPTNSILHFEFASLLNLDLHAAPTPLPRADATSTAGIGERAKVIDEDSDSEISGDDSDGEDADCRSEGKTSISSYAFMLLATVQCTTPERDQAVLSGSRSEVRFADDAWRKQTCAEMQRSMYAKRAELENQSPIVQAIRERHTLRAEPEMAKLATKQKTKVNNERYTPCTLRDLAYRASRPAEGDDGDRLEAQIKRFKSPGWLDSGASMSCVDRRTAEEMQRNGADVVRYETSRAMQARVVGGGMVQVYGEATMEILVKDVKTDLWHMCKERFFVIDGPRTMILGVSFFINFGIELAIDKGFARFKLDGGREFDAAVEVGRPGAVAAAVSMVQPLLYTAEKQTVLKYGWSSVRLKAPLEYANRPLQISPLPKSDADAYVNQVGIRPAECVLTVDKDGYITVPIFNPTGTDRQLPAMTPVAHFSTNNEVRKADENQLDADTIVNNLHIEGVSEEELQKKREDVKNFIILNREGYFSFDRLGRSRVGEFHFETKTVDDGSNAPPNIPSRPLNKDQIAAAREIWQKMVDQGVLVPSTSPWGAPIVMVRKPKGGWRMCLDYRACNALATKQHYPLKKVQEAIDTIGKAKYFSSVDALSAFWQIPCSAETQPKTAINFPWGKFEMTVMPMGAQAASATYQRIVDVLLRDLTFAVGYIDDCLVFSETWEDHLAHVAVVLDRIGGAGFTLNPKKCEIGRRSTKFLGHVVSAEGTRPDPDKLGPVKNASFPTVRKDLHHWVSLVGFYSQYIPNFALLTAPIHEYIHAKLERAPNGKMVVPPPSQAVKSAFERIKEYLCSDLIVVRPDFSKPFILVVDASLLNGAGTVLMQLDDEGRERVVAWWSVKWIESALNWAPVEHECYAFRRGTERFKDYLHWQCFKAYTDSEPITWIQTLRRPKGRLAEWILEMQALDYIIIHRPGALNIVADALSRLGLTSEKLTVASTELVKVAREITPRRWQARPVDCVVTDGVSVLVQPALMGGCVFPRACKVTKAEEVQSVAIRALAGVEPGALTVKEAALQALLKPAKVVKTESVVYAVFVCSRDAVLQALGCDASGNSCNVVWRGLEQAERGLSEDARAFVQAVDMVSGAGRLPRKLPFADESVQARAARSALQRLVHRRLHTVLCSGDRRREKAAGMVQRAIRAWMRRRATAGAQASAVPEVAAADTGIGAAPARTLGDGRVVPTHLLASETDVFDALCLIEAYLTQHRDTEDDFIFIDYEYDMRTFGIDVVQVAVGPHIFVFDTLRCVKCLNQRSMVRPSQQCRGPQQVATLRYWLESPDTRIGMQSCNNDCVKLRRHYQITPVNVFDTHIADGVLRRTPDGGRGMEKLVRHYLPFSHMTKKYDIDHFLMPWRRRPLAEDAFEYAWQDVVDGIALCKAMWALLNEVQMATVLVLSTQRVEGPLPKRIRRAVAVLHDGSQMLMVEGEHGQQLPCVLSQPQLLVPEERKKEYSKWARTELAALLKETVFEVASLPKVRSLGRLTYAWDTAAFAVRLESHEIQAIRECVKGSSVIAMADAVTGRAECNADFRGVIRRLSGVVLAGPGQTALGLAVEPLRPNSAPVVGDVATANVAEDELNGYRWIAVIGGSMEGVYSVEENAVDRFIDNVADDDETVRADSPPRAFVVDGRQQGEALVAKERAYRDSVTLWSDAALGLLPRAMELRVADGEWPKLNAAEPVPEQQELRYLYGEEAQQYDVREFTHVAVVLRSGDKCILLDRNPTSLVARADPSVRAVPTLATTDTLYGKFRAQHAMHMLFGPFKSFEESWENYRGLRLHGVVVGGDKKQSCTGVFECVVPIRKAFLNKVFDARQCTPTNRALFPGYAVCGPAERQGLCELDKFIVSNVCGQAVEEAPTVAGVDAPPLPPKEVQEDMSAGEARAETRKQAGRAPGVQPASQEAEAEMQADFGHGGFIPRVRDPRALLQELMPKAALLAPEELAKAQAEDPECRLIRAKLQGGVGVKEILQELSAEEKDEIRKGENAIARAEFKEVDGVLYCVDNFGASNSKEEPVLRFVMPKALRRDFVVACHDGCGHPGVRRTLRIAAARAWWPGMRRTVEGVVGCCPTCLFNKVQPYKGGQHIPENGSEPWQAVQVDIVHLHPCKSGKEKAVVFYDRFSRDVEAFAVGGDVDTATILSIIIFEVVPRHGWFRVLYTDRGSNLISEEARGFYELMGIELRAADAHMHTAVAGCERFNATLRMLARAAHFDHGYQWDLMLPMLIAWYKQSVQTSTGYSPFYLNHGRDAVQPWDIAKGPKRVTGDVTSYVRSQFAALHLARICAEHDVMMREEKQRNAHNKRYQVTMRLEKDDRVLVLQAGRKSKMHMPYVGPFRVAEVLERDRYRLIGRQGAKHLHHEFHISRLKLWPAGADEEDIYLDEEYYDVDHIVDHRIHNGVMEYRVRWTGYSAEDDSWVPFQEMNAACARAALEYIEGMPEDAFPDRIRRGKPAAHPKQTVPEQTVPDVVDSKDRPATGTTGQQGAQHVLTPVQVNKREERLAARQRRMGPAPGTEKLAPEKVEAIRKMQQMLQRKLVEGGEVTENTAPEVGRATNNA